MREDRLVRYKNCFVGRFTYKFEQRMHSDRELCYAVKVSKLLTQVAVGFVPEVGGALAAAVELVYDYGESRAKRKKGKPSHIEMQGYKYERDELIIQMDIVAMEAARRYQFFILNSLENVDAIIPFAKAGADQVLTYCLKKERFFIGNAIDGFLLGKSVNVQALQVRREVEKAKRRFSPGKYYAHKAYKCAGIIDANGKLYTTSKISFIGDMQDPKYGYVQLPQVVIEYLKDKHKSLAIREQDQSKLSAKLKDLLREYFPPWVTINKRSLAEFYRQNKDKADKISLVDYMKEKLGYPDREFVKLVFYSLEKPEDIDLTEYNFSGFNLSYGVFNFCRFGHSLNGTKFNNGYLRGADFKKVTDVRNAEFKDTHIEFIMANDKCFLGSNFLKTYCHYGQFKRAQIDETSWSQAIGFEKANTNDIDLSGIDGEKVQSFLKKFYIKDNKIKDIAGPEFTIGGRRNPVDLKLVLDRKEGSDNKLTPDKFMTCHDEEVIDRRGECNNDHESEAINLEKIFDLMEGYDESVLAYIYGQTGAGKTTAVRIIANQWSKGLWPEIKYLFLLNCRSLTLELEHFHEKYKQIDLASWIYHYQHKIHDGGADQSGISFASKGYVHKDFKKFIERIMERESDKVMFILDDMDELPSQHCGQNVIGKFERREFGNCKVIMTSRYKAGLQVDKKRIDIKLIGFNKEGIEQYVESFFEEKEEKKVFIKSLKHVVKHNWVLEKVAHIPALLNMLSGVFERQKKYCPLEPHNLAVIYNEIKDSFLEKAAEKNGMNFGGSTVLRKISRASNFYGSHFKILARLAFLGFSQRLATLPMAMLMDLVDEAVEKGIVAKDPESKKAFIDTMLRFGFTRCLADGGIDFFYKSFQEYLAAWYAVNSAAWDTTKESELKEVSYFIERTLFHPSYRVFYQFYLYMIKDNKQQLEWLLSQFNEAQKLVGEKFVHYIVWCLEAVMPKGADGKNLAPLEGVSEDIQKVCFTRLLKYCNVRFDEMVKCFGSQDGSLRRKSVYDVAWLFSYKKVFEYLYTMNGNRLCEVLTSEKGVGQYDLKLNIYRMLTRGNGREAIYCNRIYRQLLIDLKRKDLLGPSAVSVILSLDVIYADEKLVEGVFWKHNFQPTEGIKVDESKAICFEIGERKLLYSAPFIQYLGGVLASKYSDNIRRVIYFVATYMEYIPNEMADNIELMLTDQDPAIRKLSVELLGLRGATNLGDIVQERIVDVFIEYNYLGDKELREEVFSILIRCNKINKVRKEKLLSEVIKQQDEDSNTLIIVIQCASSLGEQDVLDSALARTAELIKDIKSPEHPIIEFIFSNSDIFINVKGSIIDLIIRFLSRGGENDFRFVLEPLESIDDCYLTEGVQEVLTRIAKSREVSCAFRGKALNVLVKVKEGAMDELIRGVEKDSGRAESMLEIVKYIDRCYITEDMVACLFQCLSGSNAELRDQLWCTIEALLCNGLRGKKRDCIPRSYYSNPELMLGILNNLKKRKDGVVTPWLTEIKKYIECCEVELTTEMMQELIDIVASAKEDNACRREAISIIGKVGEKGLFPKELKSEICTTLNKALDDKDDIIGWLSFVAMADYGKGWLELYFEKIKLLLNRAMLSEGGLFFIDIPSHVAKKIADIIFTLEKPEFTRAFVKFIADKLEDSQLERGIVNTVVELGDVAVTEPVFEYLARALLNGLECMPSYVGEVWLQVGRYLTRSADRFLNVINLKNMRLRAVQLFSIINLWCNGEHSIMIYNDRGRRGVSILHVVSYGGGGYDKEYSIPFDYISELRKILEEGVKLMYRIKLKRSGSLGEWEPYLRMCEESSKMSVSSECSVLGEKNEGVGGNALKVGAASKKVLKTA